MELDNVGVGLDFPEDMLLKQVPFELLELQVEHARAQARVVVRLLAERQFPGDLRPRWVKVRKMSGFPKFRTSAMESA